MNVSIRNKLILSIVLPLLFIIILVAGVTISLLGQRARTTLHDQSILLTRNLAERMDSQFREVAQIALTTAKTMEAFPEMNDLKIYEILQANINSNPLIYGSAVAFAPFQFDPDIGIYSPYVYRDGESMSLVDVARDAYDYTDGNWQWYSGPEQTGEPMWTEPFFDEGAGNILMVTYSVPFYRAGQFTGVATIDVPIEKLQELLAIEELQGLPFVIVSASGKFIAYPDKDLILNTSIQDLVKIRNDPEFEELTKSILSGQTGIGMIDNRVLSRALGDGRSWLFYSPINSTGWVFTTAVPESIILADLRTSLALAGISAAIMLILAIISISIVSTHLSKPIRKLATAVNKLSEGDLTAKVHGIDSTDELGQLANGFNQMVERLNNTIIAKAKVDAENEAVESEIQMARDVQASLLPHEFPPFPDKNEIDLHAINLAANRVAGDYFDYFFIDDEHLILVIADVSGKGVPAAMVMAVTRTIIRNLSITGNSPADILTQANELLVETSNQPVFVTIFLASYNITDGSLIYANGGHNPAYKLGQNGQVEQFGHATGTIVGMLEDVRYENKTFFLNTNEYLVLYTDGLPEARSPDGNFYGETHFQGALKSNIGSAAMDFCDTVMSEVTTFQARELNDDATLLILRRLN